MTALLLPPLTELRQLFEALDRHGRAVLGPAGLCELIDATPVQLDALRPFWDDLPPDAYLRDGGHYRRRRHTCFVVEGARVQAVPNRPHWQPVEYNALHGGIERWFEPMAPALLAQPVWSRLLVALAAQCSAQKGAQPWFVEAHQFRIDTTDGIGRPTPEGAHRDGVDFVAVLLVAREGIKGGETRVFEADGPAGMRFTMSAPWTTLLLDDRRVIHESTPIQPTADTPARADEMRGSSPVGIESDGRAVRVPEGHRDTLVLTFRARGFQGPDAV